MFKNGFISNERMSVIIAAGFNAAYDSKNGIYCLVLRLYVNFSNGFVV
jgi:hypothetical protein